MNYKKVLLATTLIFTFSHAQVSFLDFDNVCEKTDTKKSCPNNPEQIAIIQKLLNIGKNHKINVSGKYDSSTKNAIKAFQKAHNLPTTGFVGLQTKIALEEKFRELKYKATHKNSTKVATNTQKENKVKKVIAQNQPKDTTVNKEKLAKVEMAKKKEALAKKKAQEAKKLALLAAKKKKEALAKKKAQEAKRLALIEKKKKEALKKLQEEKKKQALAKKKAQEAKKLALLAAKKKKEALAKKKAQEAKRLALIEKKKKEALKKLQEEKKKQALAKKKAQEAKKLALLAVKKKKEALAKKKAQEAKRLANNTYSTKSFESFRRAVNLRKSYKVYKDYSLLRKANGRNTLVKISVRDQRVNLLVNGKVALCAPCTTGSKHKLEPNTQTYRDKHTPYGTFKIMEKIATKRSTIFGEIFVNGKLVYKGDRRKYTGPKGTFVGHPLKNWMRLTSGGIGLHASKYVKRYPGSNGCVRLPKEVSSIIFSKVNRGTKVVVSN